MNMKKILKLVEANNLRSNFNKENENSQRKNLIVMKTSLKLTKENFFSDDEGNFAYDNF